MAYGNDKLVVMHFKVRRFKNIRQSGFRTNIDLDKLKTAEILKDIENKLESMQNDVMNSDPLQIEQTWTKIKAAVV